MYLWVKRLHAEFLGHGMFIANFDRHCQIANYQCRSHLHAYQNSMKKEWSPISGNVNSYQTCSLLLFWKTADGISRCFNVYISCEGSQALFRWRDISFPANCLLISCSYFFVHWSFSYWCVKALYILGKLALCLWCELQTFSLDLEIISWIYLWWFCMQKLCINMQLNLPFSFLMAYCFYVTVRKLFPIIIL